MFARALNIPIDLGLAAEVIATGIEHKVHVAILNDQIT